MADNAEAKAENTEGESSAGGKKKLIIIIAAVALVLLLGGGGAAFFLLGGDPAAEQQAAQSEQPQEAIYTKIRTLEGKPMFVVGLRSKDGQPHYMQVYVEAKSRDPKVVETLELHMPLVVARLNSFFSDQSYDELLNVENKVAMRDRATEIVQAVLLDKINEPGIETILFTDLVMQ